LGGPAAVVARLRSILGPCPGSGSLRPSSLRVVDCTTVPGLSRTWTSRAGRAGGAWLTATWNGFGTLCARWC